MPIQDGMKAYRRTPVFTQETVPPGLLRTHQTKAGVWTLIHVVEGKLLYRVTETLEETVLEAEGEPGVIEPELRHEVAPLGTVRFFVEFYRASEENSVGVAEQLAGDQGRQRS